MPDNWVLFQIGGEPWTLAAVCLGLGVVLLLLAAGLFAVLVVRHGRTRRLVGREASGVAFNADKLGAELRTIHGPAKGVEARGTGGDIPQKQGLEMTSSRAIDTLHWGDLLR